MHTNEQFSNGLPNPFCMARDVRVMTLDAGGTGVGEGLLACTENHPFLVDGAWKRADSLVSPKRVDELNPSDVVLTHSDPAL